MLRTEAYIMRPGNDIKANVGDRIDIKFNVWNAGDEEGTFHQVIYVDGYNVCDKQMSLPAGTYRSEKICEWFSYLTDSGKITIRFIGGYASGGKWINDFDKTVYVTEKGATTCGQKFQVLDEEGSGIVNAIISGAGKTDNTNYSGIGYLQANKGSSHSVTASKRDYSSETKSCTWNCGTSCYTFRLKRTAVEKCDQYFLVNDENDNPVGGALLKCDAGQMYSGITGSASIRAEKGSTHTVTVSKTGYISKSYSCVWQCDNSWILKITKSGGNGGDKASIKITMFKPSSAETYLDGVYKGKAPMTITGLSAGTYSLKFTATGYKNLTHSVTLSSGEIKTVSISMIPSGNGGRKDTTLTWKGAVPTTGKVGEKFIFKAFLKEKGAVFGLSGKTIVVYANNTPIGNSKTSGGLDIGTATIDYVFQEPKLYHIQAKFVGDGKYNPSNTSVVNITIKKSEAGYIGDVTNMPDKKTYIVKSFVKTAGLVYQQDPTQKYKITKANNKFTIRRDDMFYKTTKHDIRLYNDTNKKIDEIKDVKAPGVGEVVTLSRSLEAAGGQDWKLNILGSKPAEPAVGEPFTLQGQLVRLPDIPAGEGLRVQFYELVEQVWKKLEYINKTMKNGIVNCGMPGKNEEGEYTFKAEYIDGKTFSEPYTLSIGGEAPPSPLSILDPIVDWVQDMFKIKDRKTAETYTYVGLGVIVVVILGGFMK